MIQRSFIELQKARRKIVIPLLLLTIIPYFSFIWVIAFNPSFFGQLIGEGSLSIGIILGFILILHIFLITFLYAYLANKKLEPLIGRLCGRR
jgi:uncharacterized membrane protein (DUF485 family)